MAAYTNLAGAGNQALTSGTTHLFVDVTIFPQGISTGRGIPTNYYHVGLLRIQFHGASYPVIPIDAAQQIIQLPQASDAFGWSLEPQAAITVTEYVF
jgi:hypothetical protein